MPAFMVVEGHVRELEAAHNLLVRLTREHGHNLQWARPRRFPNLHLERGIHKAAEVVRIEPAVDALLILRDEDDACPAHTGPAIAAWLRALKLGKIYGKITYGTSSANEVYRFDGELKFPTDNAPYTVRDYPLADRSLFLYAEYGLRDDLTLIGNLAMKRSIITTPVERTETQGIADIGLAAKYRVWKDDAHVLSATLGVAIPTGYTRDLTPPLGSGNVNLELAANSVIRSGRFRRMPPLRLGIGCAHQSLLAAPKPLPTRTPTTPMNCSWMPKLATPLPTLC